ncbi:alpha/beta hydrolase [Hyphococcus sp. DH-69]|uniref:alpha/beta hydrolase n=1 Tax=Hyphococcus formosus TaxID=3143534 RepID=UPI00398B8B33
MMRLVAIAILFVLNISVGAAENQLAVGELTARALPSQGVQAFSYRSKVTGRLYDITIRFPRQFRENPDAKFPALVITDGNRFFSAANFALNAVEAELGKPMILVAIGTPFEEGYAAYNRRRVHEFSTSGWNLKDPFGKTIEQSCREWKLTPKDCLGGADEFLEFIAGELLPTLSGPFRIDQNDLTLGGVSAGGFFAAWTVFQEASPFSNYIISSPALAYGDGEVFRQERRFADKNDDLDVGIYMSSGSLEIDHPYIEALGRVISGQAQLGGVLNSRAYENLTLHSEIHNGLGHVDAAAAAYARGLRLLRGAKPAESAQ